MMETETLEEYKARIWARLTALSKMEFPQSRTYMKPDGTWAEREPVPGYMEEERLQQIWWQIMAYENWFNSCHNHLLISLRLDGLANQLKDQPEPMDIELLYRIAVSVYHNAPLCY